MAHQSITLETSWLTRASNELLWRPPAGSRPQVDAALLVSGVSVTRFWSNMLMRIRDGSLASPHLVRLDFTDSNSQAGFGGGTGQSLSPAFNASGKIGVNYKTHAWVLHDDYVGDDSAEPYLWEVLGLSAGTPGGTLNEFIGAVNDGESAVDAELIIWDGQGADPFAAAPEATVIGWIGSTPVTKGWLGGTEIEKRWLGASGL